MTGVAARFIRSIFCVAWILCVVVPVLVGLNWWLVTDVLGPLLPDSPGWANAAGVAALVGACVLMTLAAGVVLLIPIGSPVGVNVRVVNPERAHSPRVPPVQHRSAGARVIQTQQIVGPRN
jgi:hypothetical protein